MEHKAKVLLVDDHPVVREGLTQIIDREMDLFVCGEAGDAAGAIEGIVNKKPNVVIADISLQETDGIELIKTIRSKHKKLPVLVFSMHDESLYAERALMAGANGYIMKGEPNAQLLVAIRHVLQGHTYVSEKMGRHHARDWEPLSSQDFQPPFHPQKRPFGSPFSD